LPPLKKKKGGKKALTQGGGVGQERYYDGPGGAFFGFAQR